MYLTIKQELNHLNKQEYKILRTLSHKAKNLVNEAIYFCRQEYFNNGSYSGYNKIYKALKQSINYKTLNSNMAQQILKEVDSSFQSFFSLIKKVKKGEYNFKDCKLPHYLDKDDFYTLIIGFIRISDNLLIIPYSNKFRKDNKPVIIKIPPILKDKTIKEIRIIPKSKARFFEIQYIYETEVVQRELDKTKALSIDFGINNLMTIVTNKGNTFIIDGRKLKSINQFYNKENSRLQRIKNKQNYGKETTEKQALITRKRNNRINDYLSKSARYVTNYCIKENIGIIICGYNQDFQKSSNLGKRNNQIFCNIPFGKLLNKIKYLCKMNGIEFIKQEESYTSKASFFDGDEIPVYDKNNKGNKDISKNKPIFSGIRIKRGLYKTKEGKLINADINAALNIMKKSKVVSLETLYLSGDVDTPKRIRIA